MQVNSAREFIRKIVNVPTAVRKSFGQETSGIYVLLGFSVKTSVGAWLAFLACIGAFIYCFVEEESYKTKLGDLSSDLLPKFITDNQDLIDYANEKGYNISSFEGHVDESSQAERKAIGNEPLKTIEDNPDQKTYCHKCGKKLKPDSDFCSYCGADLRQ